MASEIIRLEKVGKRLNIGLLYAIPPAKLIEIGSTGKYPVLTPAPTEGVLYEVLTQAEKDALNAGTSVLKRKHLDIVDGTTPGQLLGYVRALYDSLKAPAIAEYEARFEGIGQRYDAV